MFTPSQRILFIGQILGIVLYSYDELAVNTVMPFITAELDGDHLYGASFAFYMVGALLSVVWAGAKVDESGPKVPMALGCVLFASGLSLASITPNMEIFVLARLLQGMGGGIFYAVLFALTAHGYEEEKRGRVVAWTSAAWVLPAMIGPVSAAWIHETWHWRWVFAIQVPMVAMSWIMVVKALQQLPPFTQSSRASKKRLIGIALMIALMIGIGSLILTNGTSAWYLGGGLAFVIIGVLLVKKILPASMRGPRNSQRLLVVSRGMVHYAFYAADIFIPLALIRYYEVSAIVAGVMMVSGAIGWSGVSVWAGVAKKAPNYRHQNILGGLLMALALMITIAVIALDYSYAWHVLTWAIIGTGMGLSYNAIATMLINDAPELEVGRTSTVAAMSDSISIIIAAGIGGFILNATSLYSAMIAQFGLAALGGLAVMLLAASPVLSTQSRQDLS